MAHFSLHSLRVVPYLSANKGRGTAHPHQGLAALPFIPHLAYIGVVLP